MLQPVVDGIINASWIALVAVGFGLVYHCARFFHFAHGMVFVVAAYFVFLFNGVLGISLWLSVGLAVLLAAALGSSVEALLYRRLRHSGSSSLALLVASLGVYVVLQNITALAFGNETQTVRSGPVRQGVPILGARITEVQILTICVSGALLVLVVVLLGRRESGRRCGRWQTTRSLPAFVGSTLTGSS